MAGGLGLTAGAVGSVLFATKAGLAVVGSLFGVAGAGLTGEWLCATMLFAIEFVACFNRFYLIIQYNYKYCYSGIKPTRVSMLKSI